MGKEVLELIEKETNKSERKLYKLFKDVERENKEQLSKYSFYLEDAPKSCAIQLSTDDMFGTERVIERDGHKVYLFNHWISSNVKPDNVELKEGRYPVLGLAMWYTPYHYMTSITTDELYRQSETEKVLYENEWYGVKISLVRKYVIPNRHSYQWCHKISDPKYVMFIRNEKPTKKYLKMKEKLVEMSKKKRVGEVTSEEYLKFNSKVRKERMKGYVWQEIICEKTLKELFNKARRYFNDWNEPTS